MQEYDEGDQSSPYPSYQRNPATGLPTMSNNTHSQGFGGSPDGFNYGQEIHRSNPMHAVPGDEQRIEGLIESQRLLDKIPSSRGFVDCQFNGIVDLLNGNGDETTKVEVIYAIQSMRLDYCKSGGILPYDQAVIASYFVGKEWMHETVSKIVDWFSGAYRFNIIDDQMAQLEPFRERFYQPDMPPDNWATPLPPPTFHALMEDAPELPAERMALTKTGKYQGYILNAEHAQTFYKEYLASTKWTKGSLDIEGFPEDDAGMRALVKQAFEAILNVKGFGESQSTTTAHKRAKDVTWTDQGVEIMAWRLLMSCKDAQMGICNVPGWLTDRRVLAQRSEYPTFKHRWDDLIDTLTTSKVVASSLFDVSFVDRLVWNLRGEVARKRANATGNGPRNELLRQKTEAKKHNSA